MFSRVFGRAKIGLGKGRTLFIRKWGKLLAPYQKSILGHDVTFYVCHQTFDIFLSRETRVFHQTFDKSTEHSLKVSNVP
jgi:hypothetical protein